ncbi:MAG: hypothetical protein HFH15_16260 [Ruminococcus sp.]|jgi:hypothetical protein|nr:hypothetical protein [Ruminococcus sp.]
MSKPIGIKEELYRYFDHSTSAPSKAAFYKQRKKLKDEAFRSLLSSFTLECKKHPSKKNILWLQVMAPQRIFSEIRMTRILTLSQSGPAEPSHVKQGSNFHSAFVIAALALTGFRYFEQGNQAIQSEFPDNLHTLSNTLFIRKNISRKSPLLSRFQHFRILLLQEGLYLH